MLNNNSTEKSESTNATTKTIKTNCTNEVNQKPLKLIELDEHDVNINAENSSKNKWTECKFNLKDLPKLYAALAKQNLTSKYHFSDIND